MDVFLMIRRKKLTIFTDAKDTTTVLELKKMIEGILKVAPPSQMLFNKDSQLMEDEKTLAEYGLTSATAKAQCPAPIGLALRKENGEFEALELTPYSSPPDLPDVMKSQETNGQEQALPLKWEDKEEKQMKTKKERELMIRQSIHFMIPNHKSYEKYPALPENDCLHFLVEHLTPHN